MLYPNCTRNHATTYSILYNTLLNSDRLIGAAVSGHVILNRKFQLQLYDTFYSIALFVFSINRIRQNASRTVIAVYFNLIFKTQ
jgi:hypothetical protein